ncbi:hypothetical protein VNO77_21613 [Canavalia gladiata]|uniref:Uncharacterized protein n=1 Tax=Canavalia gladiata TaxID=3824 RepID=A0AAN9QNL4_CANGL
MPFHASLNIMLHCCKIRLEYKYSNGIQIYVVLISNLENYILALLKIKWGPSRNEVLLSTVGDTEWNRTTPTLPKSNSHQSPMLLNALVSYLSNLQQLTLNYP